jgi:DNA-binding GntR family transcriptional regulator
LEGLCVRLATEKVPPQTWQEFVDLFGEPMEAHVRAGDFDAFLANYERFRHRFIECANNPVAAQMLDSIYEKTNVVIRRTVILPGRAQTGLVQHRAVVAAMRQGDAEAAERLKRANLEGAKEYLRRFEKYVL